MLKPELITFYSKPFPDSQKQQINTGRIVAYTPNITL